MLFVVTRALLLSSLFVVGCGGAPVPEPTPPPPEPTLPSDEVLLASRPYRVVTPAGFDGGTPLPLLIALHGYGSSGLVLDQDFNLTRFASSHDLLLVTPDAVPDGAGNRAWHAVYTVAKSPFDREYLRALIRQVKVTHPVDPSRVFVFGYSQGAHMAHRLACDSADLVAAFASLAGQAPLNPEDCTPSRPVTALQVHGTDDEAIGYDGDLTPPVDPKIPSAHQSIETWARLDGCGPLAARTRTLDLSGAVDGAETTIEGADGCPVGVDVELWTMTGVRHWPTPQPNFFALVYGFLATHPRR